jgi:hypothetical protein
MIRENLGDRFECIGDEHLAFPYDGARPQAMGKGLPPETGYSLGWLE